MSTLRFLTPVAEEETLLQQIAPDPQRHAPPDMQAAIAHPVKWRAATRVGFRFAFVYLVLYLFPFPLYYLGLNPPDPWEKVVPWLARHLFHLEITTRYGDGGGDTLYGYAWNVFLAALAAFTTAMWSLLDRDRAHDDSLYRWLRLWVRVYLGTMMFSYGMVKVLPFQMLPPSQSRLLMRLGDMSPMSLAWAFMGSSTAYARFTGLVEVLGGALLFVPSLTTLGALICTGALAQVFTLNMGYDVPVKLFSFNLLLISLFLLAPDLRRLADMLVFNRRVEPVSQGATVSAQVAEPRAPDGPARLRQLCFGDRLGPRLSPAQEL